MGYRVWGLFPALALRIHLGLRPKTPREPLGAQPPSAGNEAPEKGQPPLIPPGLSEAFLPIFPQAFPFLPDLVTIRPYERVILSLSPKDKMRPGSGTKGNSCARRMNLRMDVRRAVNMCRPSPCLPPLPDATKSSALSAFPYICLSSPLVPRREATSRRTLCVPGVMASGAGPLARGLGRSPKWEPKAKAGKSPQTRFPLGRSPNNGVKGTLSPSGAWGKAPAGFGAAPQIVPPVDESPSLWYDKQW